MNDTKNLVEIFLQSNVELIDRHLYFFPQFDASIKKDILEKEWLNQYEFSYDLYFDFIKKTSELSRHKKIYYYNSSPLAQWIKSFWLPTFFEPDVSYGYEYTSKLKLKTNIRFDDYHQSLFKILFYHASCLKLEIVEWESQAIHYQEYLELLKKVNENLFDELTSTPSDELHVFTRTYVDQDVQLYANNILNSIQVKTESSSEHTYKKIIDFINRLLEDRFLFNYTISFEGASTKNLNVKDIPNVGVNALFANIANFPSLHLDIKHYIQLATQLYSTYYTYEDVFIPRGFFAALALLLQDTKYFDSFIQYFDEKIVNCNDLTGIEVGIPSAFLRQHGTTIENARMYYQLYVHLTIHEGYPNLDGDYEACFNSQNFFPIVLNLKKEFSANYGEWFDFLCGLLGYGTYLSGDFEKYGLIDPQ